MKKENEKKLKESIILLYAWFENHNTKNVFENFNDTINEVAEKVKEEIGISAFMQKVTLSANAINSCKVLFNMNEIAAQANKKAKMMYSYCKDKNDVNYLITTFCLIYAMKALITNEIKINITEHNPSTSSGLNIVN